MKVLVLGSTGMLGQNLISSFKSKGLFVQGIARKNADFNIDVTEDLFNLREIIEQNQYDIVINTIALINLDYCEKNPGKAYMVNTYVAGEIAKICSELNIYFVQISTDHYYKDNQDVLHHESDTIKLLNEYAKTKYLAEQLVGLYSNTLILRTNILGFRNSITPTFIEWILQTLQINEEITGYTNMYTSSIDVQSFSEILYQLLMKKETGLFNLAAKGAISKYDFIKSMANKFDKGHLIKEGYLENQSVQRGNSLGLSIEKLQTKYPSLKIPTVLQVIDNLYEQYIYDNRGEVR